MSHVFKYMKLYLDGITWALSSTEGYILDHPDAESEKMAVSESTLTRCGGYSLSF